MYDRGEGAPVIVIPGIQGRWEWMRPALDALARRCRTISYSLCGDLGSGARMDPALGFDNFLRQLDGVYERAGLERAALCGVSYGGFIALRYAATRPERVTALVLTSAPPPGWHPDARQTRYIARPWLSAPAFILTSPVRLLPEIWRACGGAWRGTRFALRQLVRVACAPMIPGLMAGRIAIQQRLDFVPDCQCLRVPALVVTGEPALDKVVPVEQSRRYLVLLPDACYEQIERTGHLGLLTRSDRFSEIVAGFVHAHGH